jgi:hypothetical protein
MERTVYETARTNHGTTIDVLWYSAVIASGWLTPTTTDRRPKAISATTPKFTDLLRVAAGSAM